MKNPCKSCEKPCCHKCNKFVNSECVDYKNRPDSCKIFPWIFNPYRGELQVLHTCPQWEYFEKQGCPDPNYVVNFTLKELRISSAFKEVEISKNVIINVETKSVWHVLNKLVDIKGDNPADVGRFILKDWMGDPIEELEKYGISIKTKGGGLSI